MIVNTFSSVTHDINFFLKLCRILKETFIRDLIYDSRWEDDEMEKENDYIDLH